MNAFAFVFAFPLPFPGLCIFLRLFPLHNLTYCESPLPFHFLASVRSAYPSTLRVQTGCGGGGSDRIGAVCDRRRCGDRDRESEISDGDATRHEPCHPSIDRSRVWDPGPGSLWTMVETSSQRSGVDLDLDLDHHHHRAQRRILAPRFGRCFFRNKEKWVGMGFCKADKKDQQRFEISRRGFFFLVVRGVNVRP